MARFYGEVGYGIPEEDPPGSGKWKDKMAEQSYQGDVVRKSSNLDSADKANPDISLSGNSISIVADQYAIEHFANIKYVVWGGVRWAVTSVSVQSPRLILNLGSVYNGSTP